jgi:dTDP-4-amino-4,6-dideoxygalactose transaminase
MIDFVEKKQVCWDSVREHLSKSMRANHWTNFGPVASCLEGRLHGLFELPSNLSVVATTSGTAALFALVSLHSYIKQRPLRWVVSSYGFACTIQGPLSSASIIDCDKSGAFDLELLQDCDGIIVTNVFGTIDSMEKYVDYCNKKKIILVIDSALNFNSCPHLANDFISFHQTKPWGMGEGGCFIVEKQYEEIARKIINFGSFSDDTHRFSFNGKISDIAAAFILDRLYEIESIKKTYRKQYDRIKNIAISNGYKLLADNKGIPASVPLLAPKPISELNNSLVKLQKYYRPLRSTPNATDIYSKMINFPCHKNLDKLSDEEIHECIRKL